MNAATTIDFASWYRDRYRVLHATVLAFTGDPEIATEAADEAFVRALQHWKRVSQMDSPDGWVWVVARNCARRAARRRARERRVLSEPGAPTPGPAADVGVELWDAVERLPPRERELVALRYVFGFGEAEIARALGLAAGTVARSLHDARAHLRDALRDPETEETR